MKSVIHPSYERIDNEGMVRVLMDTIPNLTYEQKESIRDTYEPRFNIFTNNNYVVYKRQDSSEYSKLWRLTLPFYILYFILLHILSPLNYFIYGGFHYRSGFYRRMVKPWEIRL